jgi:hypothetical protein
VIGVGLGIRRHFSSRPLITSTVTVISDIDLTATTTDTRVSVTRLGSTRSRRTSSGTVEVIGANLPRIDYDPSSLAARGLLIEEARTNLVLQSQTLATTWAAADFTVTQNVEGVADAITETATTAEHIHDQTVSKAASSLTYTYTIEAKLASGTRHLQIRLDSGSGTNAGNFRFNLQTGAVISATAGGTFSSASSSIENLGGGWYRLIAKITTGTETSIRIRHIGYDGTTTNYLGSTGVTFRLRYAELQQVSTVAALSVTPTTTAAVAGAADVATMTTASIVGYTAGRGTIRIDGRSGRLTTQQQQTLFQRDDGTANNCIRLIRNTSQELRWQIVAGGVTQCDISMGTLAASTSFKTALAYDTNNARACRDAGTVSTDSSVTVPSGLTTDRFGSNATPGEYLNGWIARKKDWNGVIQDAELIAETQPTTSVQPTAFPGAVGPGRFATGGRGGTIIHVTNLSDSGAGSFRNALTSSGARTIVFDVAGTITLSSRINVGTGDFTIAGESAPGNVEIFGWDIVIAASNFIIRHMIFRGANLTGGTLDSLGFVNGASNGILDHCTFQWGGDETLQFYSTNTTTMSDITVQDCLILECIETGNVICKGTERFLMYRTIMGFANERHPRIHAGGGTGQGPVVKTEGELINCMSYNGARFAAECQIGDTTATSAAPVKWAFRNNWYVAGPDTDTSKAFIQTLSGSWGTGTQIYHSGNSGPNGRSVFSNSLSFNPVVASNPVDNGLDSSLIATADAALETSLLNNCGARPTGREVQTTRALDKIIARTGSNQGSVAGYGGHTNLTSSTSTYVEPTNPNSDNDGDGWTNIEEDLHLRAVALLNP